MDLERWVATLPLRFRSIFRRTRVEAELEEELRYHLDRLIEQNLAGGMTADEARAAAVRQMGELGRHKEQARDARRVRWLENLLQDLRYAVRQLGRSPLFTAVAVATLALGIGANSAIFSVVHGVLLDSLPFREADDLYVVQTLYPDGTGYALSPPDFMSVRQDNRAFEQVESYTNDQSTLLGTGEPREIDEVYVSDGLFEMLGMPMTIGRGFLAQEMQAGSSGVVVLDHGFWQREFGGDPGVVGRVLNLDGQPNQVVGVLEEGFSLPAEVDLYRPLEYDETFDATTADARRGEYLRVLARARTSVTEEAIQADVRRVGSALQSAFPQTNQALTFRAVSLRETIVGDVRAPLLMLLGAVGLVLLVACANVANLLLARASSRQGELAVRSALGAGRGRLVRQLLTESLVLGGLGGAMGLLIAFTSTRALVAAQPAAIPRLEEVTLDGTVVLFTLATTLLAALVFGTLPSLQATGGRLSAALRRGGRGGGAGGGGQRLRSALVVTEMALAVVLLFGAGLLIRSFVELTRVDPGFDVEGAVAFRISLPGNSYEGAPEILNAVDQLRERLQTLSGVTAVGAASALPLAGRGSLWSFSVPGAPPPPADVNPEIGVTRVTSDYFAAIGANLRSGRAISEQDHADAPPVALINEAALARWLPNEEPIGKVVDANGERVIVGVVADVLDREPGQAARPLLYVPLAQSTVRSFNFVVRTTGEPLALAPTIRAEVSSFDPDLPIADLAPLRALVSESVSRPRFYGSVLTTFAGIGLALAATGIFGVVSYTVAQRTREIGVRMALGARGGTVLRMVVGRALALAGIGMTIGVAAALSLGRVIRSQLFGVGLLDPVTISAVVFVLGTTAALASYLPARRAAAVEPGVALNRS